ncbi:hypothetical protein [Streptomyces sp. NPDC000931]
MRTPSDGAALAAFSYVTHLLTDVTLTVGGQDTKRSRHCARTVKRR